jgi:hypothetical protein
MSNTVLTEDEIRIYERSGNEAMSAEHGGKFKVPMKLRMEFSEKVRQLWVAFVHNRDNNTTDPARRHDKTDRLDEFCSAHIGGWVTPQSLADAVECSRGTAYKYIGDNRSGFELVAKGIYKILDTDELRAAAKGRSMVTKRIAAPATSPAVASDSTIAARTVTDDVNAALGAMTGHRAPAKD